MNSAPAQERMIWAFWVAAGLAALAGLAPIVFAGISGRLSGALFPFCFGAAAFAACALTHRQGRLTTSVIYFVAGLAIVFALLAMFSLPLRLAVLGTCPTPPAPCTTGLPRPLTDAENTGLGAAAVMGILAVFVGFIGLWALYRRTALPPAAPPPARRIPPMPPRPAEEPAPEPAGDQAVEAAEPGVPEVPEVPEASEALEELPPHVEAELLELPSPESSTATT